MPTLVVVGKVDDETIPEDVCPRGPSDDDGRHFSLCDDLHLAGLPPGLHNPVIHGTAPVLREVPRRVEDDCSNPHVVELLALSGTVCEDEDWRSVRA